MSGNNKEIDNQKLLDYLEGKLSAAERHEVEQRMLNDPFLNEAAEGLQQASGNIGLQRTVDSLNKELRTYLLQKKKKRERKIFPLNGWTYLAVLFVLALAVIVYLLLKKMG